jgi:hypothetical protein
MKFIFKLDVKEAKQVQEHEQWNFTDEEKDQNGEEAPQDDGFATESDSD